MKRKSTDRKYGKEFFVSCDHDAYIWCSPAWTKFFTTEIYTNQNEAGICRGGIVPFSIFVAAEGCMICFLLRSVGIIVHVRQCVGYSFAGFFFPGSRRLHREDSPCSFII